MWVEALLHWTPKTSGRWGFCFSVSNCMTEGLMGTSLRLTLVIQHCIWPVSDIEEGTSTWTGQPAADVWLTSSPSGLRFKKKKRFSCKLWAQQKRVKTLTDCENVRNLQFNLSFESKMNRWGAESFKFERQILLDLLQLAQSIQSESSSGGDRRTSWNLPGIFWQEEDQMAEKIQAGRIATPHPIGFPPSLRTPTGVKWGDQGVTAVWSDPNNVLASARKHLSFGSVTSHGKKI